MKGLTNEWYRDLLQEWKVYTQHRYGGASYFFPRAGNGEIGHITDEQLRVKFIARAQQKTGSLQGIREISQLVGG